MALSQIEQYKVTDSGVILVHFRLAGNAWDRITLERCPPPEAPSVA
jgi:hypothetical protein